MNLFNNIVFMKTKFFYVEAHQSLVCNSALELPVKVISSQVDEDGSDDSEYEILEDEKGLKTEFLANLYTPIELIGELKSLATNVLDNTTNISKFTKTHLERLIQECDNWSEENFEVELD